MLTSNLVFRHYCTLNNISCIRYQSYFMTFQFYVRANSHILVLMAFVRLTSNSVRLNRFKCTKSSVGAKERTKNLESSHRPLQCTGI